MKGTTIRKAYSYTIDRNQINEELNHNWYALQHSLINEIFTHPYLDQIFDYEFNLDKSVEWLTGVRPVTPTPTDTITTIVYGLSYLYRILFSAVIALTFLRRKKLKKISQIFSSFYFSHIYTHKLFITIF